MIRAETTNGRTLITVALGTAQGLTKNWRGVVLRGDTDVPLPNGEITIVRVGVRTSVANVPLALETVRANPRVRFEPP